MLRRLWLSQTHPSYVAHVIALEVASGIAEDDQSMEGRAIVVAEFNLNVSSSPAMVAASKGGESQMVTSLAEHHSPQPHPLASQTLAETQIDDAGNNLRSSPATAATVKQKTIVSTSSGDSESSPEAHQRSPEKQASQEVAATGIHIC
ncbi:OLC1v1035670C1 [Oldenlandia corymbosa var. corymbosa]|uniref:OLC1v1035670C1 n=1 Tax=Oldenlandia corymbosa var. corymbosa TaxID=529605 RepID=A0AAV1CUC9_OLDCO|nr:OLC1v1035670C1 [Oldenlandia corymbosa var. corymbosa]